MDSLKVYFHFVPTK